jgi:hypothetical protein
MSLAALILISASVLCPLTGIVFRHTPPRRFQALMLLYAILCVSGSSIFLVMDVQNGSLPLVILWFIPIGASTWIACRGWKNARRAARAEGAG